MTVRKLLMSFTVIALIGTVAVVSTLTDVAARIREHYPSAAVTLHEGHSPGVHPVLSVMRLVRGQRFVPATEWISVQLTAEAKPIDLATLFQFQVISLRLTRCKVNDLAPLMRRQPSTYAEFISCDLSAVPAEQKAALRASSDNPERFVYGGP
jgi:hypothetical protein